MKLRKIYIERFFNDPARFITQLEYSQYDQTFFIRVPEHMEGFSCGDEEEQKEYIRQVDLRGGSGTLIYAFAGKTEDEVLGKAREYLALFVASLPSTRKVILYGIAYYGPGVESRGGESKSYQSSEQYASLDIDYIVCYETTHGSRKTYEERGEKNGTIFREDVTHITSAGHRVEGYHVTEWTAEREEYFDRLSKAMITLIKEIDRFISDDQEFIAKIDAGAQLLLPEAREK